MTLGLFSFSSLSFNFSAPRILINFSSLPDNLKPFSDIEGNHTFIVSKSSGDNENNSIFWNGDYVGLNPNENSIRLPISTIAQGFKEGKGKFRLHDTDSGVDYSDSSLGLYLKLPKVSGSGSVEMFVPKHERSRLKEYLDSFLNKSGTKISENAYKAAVSDSLKPKTISEKIKGFVNKIPLGPYGAKSWAGKHAYVLGAGVGLLAAAGLMGLHHYKKTKRTEEMYNRFLLAQLRNRR